jgi:hypothetical protein
LWCGRFGADVKIYEGEDMFDGEIDAKGLWTCRNEFLTNQEHTIYIGRELEHEIAGASS